MAAFKALTADQVTFRFDCEADENATRTDIHGSFATDDPEQDKADANAIIARLERGDIEAWCGIIVTAIAPDGTEADDSIWGVTLGADDTPESYAREYGMDNEALARLNDLLLAKHTPRTVRMCETKYLGPTDHRGSRVRARHITTRKCATVSWDHALDSYENHAAAAELVLGRRPEFSASVDGGGYIMGVDPRNDA